MAWWKNSIRTCIRSRKPNTVPRRCASSFSPSRAHEGSHFQEVEQQSFQGKAGIANSSVLIPFCHRVEDLENARRLLERRKEQGAKPDVSCYYTLLDGCCKFGSPEDVVAVMNEMDGSGTAPDSRAYGFLIASYAKASMLDKAAEIFQTLRRKNPGMALASSLYSSMVWIYCQADRPKDAEEFLKAMQEDRRDGDPVSYNIVISAYERTGAYNDATRIFQEMKTKVKIGQSTYKLVLEIYLRAGDHESFNKLFKEMLEAKIFGDVRTLEAAVDLYAAKSMLKDAEWMYKRLSRSGNRLTVRGYNKLLALFLAAGNVAMVNRIYREMPRVVPPDSATRRLMLTAYLRAGSFRGAVEIHEQILKENIGVQPDLDLDPECLERLVRAYVQLQKFFEAMKIVVVMRKAGLKVDEDVHNQVVTGMVSVREES